MKSFVLIKFCPGIKTESALESDHIPVQYTADEDPSHPRHGTEIDGSPAPRKKTSAMFRYLSLMDILLESCTRMACS